LTPVEEARGLQRLITGKHWTQSAAAEALGKSKAEISATLRILTLPSTVLDGVLTSELDIPKNALIELARIANPSVRDRLVKQALEGALTIRIIRAAATEIDEDTANRNTSPVPRRSADPLGKIALDRLERGLHDACVAGRSLSTMERERLRRLQGKIEELLAIG
jgi:ParB family chromosome partitioning protein